MRPLIFPLKMITDHCFPLLRHKHTHIQQNIIYPSSRPATNKYVRDTWTNKASHFKTFHYSYLLHMKTGYNYRGKREAPALSVRGTICIHIHNDRFWQQCQPQTILCHIYLSSVEILGQWEPVMNETSPRVWYIFLISRTNNTDISNEYRRLMEHRKHNSLCRQKERHNKETHALILKGLSDL